MKKTGFFTVLFLLLLILPTLSAAESEYIIGKGDTLTIQVWGEDSLGANAVVRPDGKISLPAIGSIHAADMTISQLQSNIADKLKDLVYEPMVSVAVHTFSSNSAIVYGPGIKSTVIPLMGRTTILQVLSRVVPDNNADLENTYVERNNERIASNFHALYKNGENNENNIEILAGDRIFVPLREFRFVFVEGAVGKPSSLLYYDGMTVLEAIHLAGGFTKFADRNDTVIARPTSGGTEHIPVRLHDLTAKGDFSQNIRLQGGDLIIVKTSWF